MLVLAIIVCIAAYMFREKLWDMVIAMWKDDMPDK